MALIDVLVPVKNGREFLAESLESLCAQTVRDWRVLVLDHGSDDGSLDVAEAFAARDSRIQIRCFPEAQGLSGLLNAGLEICDCRYAMRHDADDISLPRRMEQTLKAFAADPDMIAIGGQGSIIDGNGKQIGALARPVGQRRVSANCFFVNPVAHPAVTMDYPALCHVGGRYGVDFLQAVPSEHSFQVPGPAQDYFLFGQLAVLGKCSNIADDLIRYRWHGGNVGAGRFHEQMQASLKIARFLMRSLCAIHDLDYVDPAPFCNHGGQLLQIDGAIDFDGAFEALSTILRRGLGPSPDLDRELAYRHSIATRTMIDLLARHALFSFRHAAEKDERNVVREWIIGRWRGRRRLRATPESPS